MYKIILHLKAWNIWRKYNQGSKFYKFLVLLGLLSSPTMVFAYYQVGIEYGLKHWKTTIPKMKTKKKLLKKTDVDVVDNFLNDDIIRPNLGGDNNV